MSVLHLSDSSFVNFDQFRTKTVHIDNWKLIYSQLDLCTVDILGPFMIHRAGFTQSDSLELEVGSKAL